MEKNELQRLRDLPIEGVAERLGLTVSRHKALCPFHDDRHPSLSFNVRKNTFRCFVCGASGGTIDLVMKYLNKDFKEATGWLANEHNIILADESAKFQDSSYMKPETRNLKPFDASRYERFFERPFLNEEARKFLFEERRLDPRVIRWCRLTSWRDKQGVPWLQIPYYNRNGKLVGVQNRNLLVSGSLQSKAAEPSAKINFVDSCHDSAKQASLMALAAPRIQDSGNMKPETGASPMKPETSGPQPPRFRFPQGSQCGIYNLPVLNLLRPGDELYIAEGCSDCWSLLSAGHKAIAIPSATLLTQKDVELLSKLHSLGATGVFREATECGSGPTKGSESPIRDGGRSGVGPTFHMFPDRDAPGERLFLQLQKVLPSLVHHQLPPDCKDFSEYYLKNPSFGCL
ncbi:MAG: hypothetical protein K6G70_00245 [Bacteroidaceae bacterium]|nr:hypothetical protein [Bacteroidaceae bacterium]